MLKFFRHIRQRLLSENKVSKYLLYAIGEIVLVVAGIPDEIKDKILQPFFTIKKATQGTGLGLSITYDIINAHGGNLEIESHPGVLISFIIKLPST